MLCDVARSEPNTLIIVIAVVEVNFAAATDAGVACAGVAAVAASEMVLLLRCLVSWPAGWLSGQAWPAVARPGQVWPSLARPGQAWPS